MDLRGLLERVRDVRIGVLGDFCLDVYWELDDRRSEISVETGLPTRPVRRQRFSLGGAGNVVSNLEALGVGHVAAFGVTGNDAFGLEMRKLLAARGVDCDTMLIQDTEWDTPAYIKPLRAGSEENRLDFGAYNMLQDAVGTALVEKLRDRLPDLDAVIVNQQLEFGVHTPHVQAALQALLHTQPEALVVLDARLVADAYAGCLLKVNDLEATTLVGGARELGDVIPFDESRDAARQLFKARGKPVFVSRGARGCVAADADGPHVVPGLHIIEKVDPVGAGDSMTAGLAAALAADASCEEAATFGNCVAGVTVQKLGTTGTATPDEVLAIGSAADYVYAPELADDPRRARYLDGSEIECVKVLEAQPRITHAIFDHDGTISTLRQGWEMVMEPMMIRSILGDRYASADETLYARVVARVREFIDKTTGIQTLVQMQGLVDLVQEFGIVPADQVQDEFRYKEIYLEALMELVRARSAKLNRGDLDVTDFTVKKAPDLLRRLHGAGVALYLASGTDEADVAAEAGVLGYAGLFEGRIYGSVGDVKIEAKRMVLDRILGDIDRAGGGGLVTFGDGPVEIRETRKRGGLAIGVASDEVRRYGLHQGKRSRLIRAGAHAIVPDFSQLDRLSQLLGLGEGT